MTTKKEALVLYTETKMALDEVYSVQLRELQKLCKKYDDVTPINTTVEYIQGKQKAEQALKDFIELPKQEDYVNFLNIGLALAKKGNEDDEFDVREMNRLSGNFVRKMPDMEVLNAEFEPFKGKSTPNVTNGSRGPWLTEENVNKVHAHLLKLAQKNPEMSSVADTLMSTYDAWVKAKDSEKNSHEKILQYYIKFPGWGYIQNEKDKNIRMTKGDIELELQRIDDLGEEAGETLAGAGHIIKEITQAAKVRVLSKVENPKYADTQAGSEMDISELAQNPVFCIDGPPGTGKTTIAQSIADILGYGFYADSFAGKDDATMIDGRGANWVSPEPGIVAKAQYVTQREKVCILLDEGDKIGNQGLKDSLGQILEASQPYCKDSFFKANMEKRNAMYIVTTNNFDLLADHVKSRVKKIYHGGYTEDQQIEILKTYLPTALGDNDHLAKFLTTEDSDLKRKRKRINGTKVETEGFLKSNSDVDVIAYLVKNYVIEPGVREAKEMLGRVVALATVRGLKNPQVVDIDFIHEAMGGKPDSRIINIKKIRDEIGIQHKTLSEDRETLETLLKKPKADQNDQYSKELDEARTKFLESNSTYVESLTNIVGELGGIQKSNYYQQYMNDCKQGIVSAKQLSEDLDARVNMKLGKAEEKPPIENINAKGDKSKLSANEDSAESRFKALEKRINKLTKNRDTQTSRALTEGLKELKQTLSERYSQAEVKAKETALEVQLKNEVVVQELKPILQSLLSLQETISSKESNEKANIKDAITESVKGITTIAEAVKDLGVNGLQERESRAQALLIETTEKCEKVGKELDDKISREIAAAVSTNNLSTVQKLQEDRANLLASLERITGSLGSVIQNGLLGISQGLSGLQGNIVSSQQSATSVAKEEKERELERNINGMASIAEKIGDLSSNLTNIGSGQTSALQSVLEENKKVFEENMRLLREELAERNDKVGKLEEKRVKSNEVLMRKLEGSRQDFLKASTVIVKGINESVSENTDKIIEKLVALQEKVLSTELGEKISYKITEHDLVKSLKIEVDQAKALAQEVKVTLVGDASAMVGGATSGGVLSKMEEAERKLVEIQVQLEEKIRTITEKAEEKEKEKLAAESNGLKESLKAIHETLELLKTFTSAKDASVDAKLMVLEKAAEKKTGSAEAKAAQLKVVSELLEKLIGEFSRQKLSESESGKLNDRIVRLEQSLTMQNQRLPESMRSGGLSRNSSFSNRSDLDYDTDDNSSRSSSRQGRDTSSYGQHFMPMSSMHRSPSLTTGNELRGKLDTGFNVAQRLQKEALKKNKPTLGVADKLTAQSFDAICHKEITKINNMKVQDKQRLDSAIHAVNQKLSDQTDENRILKELKSSDLSRNKVSVKGKDILSFAAQNDNKYTAVERFEHKLNTIAMYDTLSAEKKGADQFVIKDAGQAIVNVNHNPNGAVSIASEIADPKDKALLEMVLFAQKCSTTGKFKIEHCENNPEAGVKLYLYGKSLGLTPELTATTMSAIDNHLSQHPMDGLAGIYKMARNPNSGSDTVLAHLKEWEDKRKNLHKGF